MNSPLILPRQPDIFVPGEIKPEADYLEIERLSQKLGLPVPQMHLRLEVTNPDGSPGAVYASRSRTYNRNFWNSMFGLYTSISNGTQTFGAGFLAMKNTAGTVTTPDWGFVYNGSASANAVHSNIGPVNDDTQGIVVGTGTTAESFEHNALVTKVLQGSTSGKLVYNASVASTASYNSGTKVWTGTLQRIFNNNSGGTIVIAEMGLYTRIAHYSAYNQIFMTCRDLLGATVSVLTGGQLTATYTPTLTFPA